MHFFTLIMSMTGRKEESSTRDPVTQQITAWKVDYFSSNKHLWATLFTVKEKNNTRAGKTGCLAQELFIKTIPLYFCDQIMWGSELLFIRSRETTTGSYSTRGITSSPVG